MAPARTRPWCSVLHHAADDEERHGSSQCLLLFLKVSEPLPRKDDRPGRWHDPFMGAEQVQIAACRTLILKQPSTVHSSSNKMQRHLKADLYSTPEILSSASKPSCALLLYHGMIHYYSNEDQEEDDGLYRSKPYRVFQRIDHCTNVAFVVTLAVQTAALGTAAVEAMDTSHRCSNLFY